MEKESKEDLGNLLDTLDHCARKIGFIAEFFTKGDPGYNFEISERGAAGVYFVLGDIEDNLGLVANGLRKAIIKERPKGSRNSQEDTSS